jgi:hypothetical protein
MIDSLAPHLTQSEKLALCPVSPFVTIREDEHDESEETARLNNHPLSARNAGFVMPSRARAGFVSILPHGEQDNDDGEAWHDDDDEQEQEQEQEQAYAPYVLPSARNRSAVSRELRAMGFSWGE